MSLDTRAREAAAALNASLDALPAGPPPLRAPSTGRRALLAAAVVLAVVAVAVIALRADERAAPVVTTPATEVPRLVPSSVPEGMAPTAAVDLPVEADLGEPTSIVVFGGPSATEPFASGDLALMWWRGSVADVEPSGSDRQVTVRGRVGRAIEGEGTEPASVHWREGDLSVGLASRHLAVDDLLAVADSVVVEGGRAELPAPPGGLGEVGRAEFSVPGVGTIILPAGAAGYAAAWQDDESGRFLAVATVAAGAGFAHVLTWLSGPADVVTVRGHAGWWLPAAGLLVWLERDDVLAAVFGDGLDAVTVREVAEGLRPATDAEWQALPGTSDQSEEEALPPVVATLPVPSDAGAMTVQLHEDGDVCLDRVMGGRPTVSCGPQVADGDLVVAVEVPMEDGTTLVYGRAPEGTVVVAVSSSTGAVAATSDISADRLWAVPLAAGEHADRVDATAADGTQLASVVPQYP